MSVLINGKQALGNTRVRFLLKNRGFTTTSLYPGSPVGVTLLLNSKRYGRGNFRCCVKRSMMPLATAQNRPLYINFNPNNPGRLFEYRPALVNGVLQWVLRPVYHLAYWIQRLIRRIRAGRDFQRNSPYAASGPGHTDPDLQNSAPYLVNLINHLPFNP